MSSNVGRNSLIMASGTMASRITGQIRTILLAACLGTTGIAANAYQTGSMIPQVLFTVISGGIFNAVLVPQIVRTLKEHDAQERLNKLITLAIALLAGMTLLMMLATPLLTMLYLDNSWGPAERALVNAFTLWCMPQIFFYGLYTVLGQILAAKDNFVTYAWSSVGANVISCAGFTMFLILFGRASRAPLEFWTTEKVMLTAGTWTLGVAFQAIVLFIPLMRLGLHYRPQWGVSGIGLKAMGPVAAWSVGVMGVQELANIVNARITNGAPFAGNDLYGIAGNGSYQNAFTLYILPYSLIAVSVGTAIFPKISRAVAERNLDEARDDLSGALRNVGVMMMYFTMAIVVMPVPITIALLPSVGVPEAKLIAGPMVALALGLPLTSAYLLIQRTFFAFEDGRHPFLFQLQVSIIQVVFEVAVMLLAPPRWWTAGVGLSMTVGYLLSFPSLVAMLRRRFDGHLDGRRIAATYLKALIAALVAGLAAWLLTDPVMLLLGASMRFDRLNWFQAFGFCALMTVVTAAVYASMLIVLRCEEFATILTSVSRRIRRR
ncbi:murein biosynthesis integral membrane protein MurJ [Bifidobacterium stellenboschense]|uniref:Membrane protein n=1 Tax=Bifidobacterium stellenboschense TaxID=762211 RepID=A0A087E0X8_9BIFI|nr:murein biosynthesis integral membrane protein MurJ [Bifidobacterium stellenboschense]KFJ01429.1 membrane protein [Bifidobacterium stellenboschense]